MMSLIMTNINVATNVIATQTTSLMTTTMSHCAQELKMGFTEYIINIILKKDNTVYFCFSANVSLAQVKIIIL